MRHAPLIRRESRRKAARAVALAAAVLSTTSCAALRPDAETAGRVASDFTTAVTAHDTGAACSLLAPATRSELESDGSSCEQALLDKQIPTGGAIEHTAAFGRSAQVVLRGDVVFLSDFNGRWLVTAAGCRPERDAPYDCALTGG
ncbi:hypothetical protein ACVBEQ_11795 [Nakamurella sp. GG22]